MSTDRAVIILGAGPPFRGEAPTVLQDTLHDKKQGKERVLDWLLAAVSEFAPRVDFVCGYAADAVMAQYPQLRYTHNEQWQHTSATASLLKTPLFAGSDTAAKPAIVSYADIVFHREAVARLLPPQFDITIAVDGQWRSRYAGRTEQDIESCEKVHVAHGAVTRLGAELDATLANAEFVGLVHFSAEVVQFLRQHQSLAAERFVAAKLAELVEWLRMQGFSVGAVDLAGDWAELNEPPDLAHFILGTKAQTLQRLQGLVSKSRIEDQFAFTVADWRQNSAGVLQEIQKAFGRSTVVVRSSALSEDGFSSANAGAYTSVLDVSPVDPAALSVAVDQVITSYPDGNGENQVLVQPMVADVQISGVVFTRTLEYGAPWYVINYDDSSGSTDSVTSGHGDGHETLFIRRDRINSVVGKLPDGIAPLIPALQEIETLLDYDSLDIEFAISDHAQVHILQVRPIAVDHAALSVDENDIQRWMQQAEQQFRDLQPALFPVVGTRAVFGLMPDWNPAEIIGTRPGRLATSLYRYLVMDDIWARQRAEYGYRDVRPAPLLRSFAGHPYVDVRASFNSFIPACIDDTLAGRLVDFYLDWLLANPSLHDKVEFDVVPTCAALDFDRWQQRLSSDSGFPQSDIKTLHMALLEITRKALRRPEQDLACTEKLKQRFDVIRRSDAPALERVRLLLSDCREFGVLPFAHLARGGFIAATLLRSAVQQEVISKAAMDDFMAGIRTVSHRLSEDARLCADGELPWQDFVQRYGHLRPGTYDITADCYASDPDRFLGPVVAAASARTPARTGELWTAARPAFMQALQRAGLCAETDAPMVETFMRTSIEGREYAKFLFTRNLSMALELLADWGRQQGLDRQGLDREALSDVAIEDLFAIATGSAGAGDTCAWLAARSQEGAHWRRQARAIELPPLLGEQSDFCVFRYPVTQPNFIGATTVTAPCIELQAGQTQGDTRGCIVLVPQADPGYDWLFGQGIAGLITMYGGANSHMAIRAAEFGLPAAIGVGEARYGKLSGASSLVLDAVNRHIHVVQ